MRICSLVCFLFDVSSFRVLLGFVPMFAGDELVRARLLAIVRHLWGLAGGSALRVCTAGRPCGAAVRGGPVGQPCGAALRCGTAGPKTQGPRPKAQAETKGQAQAQG